MTGFATVDDLELLWRKLTIDEKERAAALLEVVSDVLRVEGEKVGKDLDMLALNPAYSNTLKSVAIDVTSRVLMANTTKEPLTQESQSAMGYTWSGSYLTPGGGIFIKDSELKRLGLKKPRYGAIDIYGTDKRDRNNTN